MKWRCVILTLVSIYRIGDESAFMIKGDMSAFMMGDGMGDTSAFMIKGDAPRATCVSFTCIIGDVQLECVSPFYQRSGRVSDINLTEMRRKQDCLLFTFHRASSAPQ
jgi:hypothetical protein